jgi:hypothetical protein
MSELTLIQEQRTILYRLSQTTAHHIQITTTADAQWQEAQSAYKEAQPAQHEGEKPLRNAAMLLSRATT